MAQFESQVLQVEGTFGMGGEISSTLPTTVPAANAIVLYVRRATKADCDDVTVEDEQGNPYTRIIPSVLVPAGLEGENGAWFFKRDFSADQDAVWFNWPGGSGFPLRLFGSGTARPGGSDPEDIPLAVSPDGSNDLALASFTADNSGSHTVFMQFIYLKAP